VRAYHEWLPIRQTDVNDKLRIWRNFQVRPFRAAASGGGMVLMGPAYSRSESYWYVYEDGRARRFAHNLHHRISLCSILASMTAT
jgi:hypothetical protein